MVEPAFRLILTGDAAINAVVQGRVFHNVRPADERRPSLVLQRVSTFFARRFGGDSGVTKGRMQINVMGESYQTVKELAELVHKRVDGFVGTIGGTRFHWVEVEDHRDVPAAPLAGRATPLYVVSIDARFLYAN